MPRWTYILIAAVIGIGLGLLYGWQINPVQFVDLTPDTLRADYRADYVLMVAEAYHAEHGPELAARRLAIFGSDPPARIAARGLEDARQSGFAEPELALIQELVHALQIWQPVPGGVLP